MSCRWSARPRRAARRFIATPEGTNILQKDRAQLLPQLTRLEDDPWWPACAQAAQRRSASGS